MKLFGKRKARIQELEAQVEHLQNLVKHWRGRAAFYGDIEAKTLIVIEDYGHNLAKAFYGEKK